MLRHRKRGRHHRATGMKPPRQMRIVGFIGMGGHRPRKRGLHRWQPQRRARQRGAARSGPGRPVEVG